MARYKSRSKRCGEACGQLSAASTDLSAVIDGIDAIGEDGPGGALNHVDDKLMEEWGKMLNAAEDNTSSAFAEVESLTDEMRQWEENTAENFSGTDKYQRVSEAAETLENAKGELESIDWPQLLSGTLEEWGELKEKLEEIRTTIDDQESELSGVDFPSMFG